MTAIFRDAELDALHGQGEGRTASKSMIDIASASCDGTATPTMGKSSPTIREQYNGQNKEGLLAHIYVMTRDSRSFFMDIVIEG